MLNLGRGCAHSLDPRYMREQPTLAWHRPFIDTTVSFRTRGDDDKSHLNTWLFPTLYGGSLCIDTCYHSSVLGVAPKAASPEHRNTVANHNALCHDPQTQ